MGRGVYRGPLHTEIVSGRFSLTVENTRGSNEYIRVFGSLTMAEVTKYKLRSSSVHQRRD
jgi:hypothetical protein